MSQPKSSKPEDAEDFAAFRAEMQGVKPRAPSPRLSPRSAPPSPQARQAQADERVVLAELLDGPDPETYESGDTLAYRSDGIQDSVWRRLRRGTYRLDRELDLHGFNREAARRVLAEFLAYCEDHDLRCVRIIHGKGNGSPNSGPVLKTSVDGWLRRRKQVLAFCSARPQDGGTGAIYVLLRRADRSPNG